MTLKEIKVEQYCPKCKGVMVYVGVRNKLGDISPVDEEWGIYKGYRCMCCGRHYINIPQ